MLSPVAAGWHELPNPAEFDEWHAECRDNLIRKAPDFIGSGSGRVFTHGVAAKLNNCYLKPLFVVGVTGTLTRELENKRDAIHPPIDRVLLNELTKRNVANKPSFWRSYRDKGWSNFTADDYEVVIDAVRETTDGVLWKIEKFWQGFQ